MNLSTGLRAQRLLKAHVVANAGQSAITRLTCCRVSIGWRRAHWSISVRMTHSTTLFSMPRLAALTHCPTSEGLRSNVRLTSEIVVFVLTMSGHQRHLALGYPTLDVVFPQVAHRFFLQRWHLSRNSLGQCRRPKPANRRR